MGPIETRMETKLRKPLGKKTLSICCIGLQVQASGGGGMVEREPKTHFKDLKRAHQEKGKRMEEKQKQEAIRACIGMKTSQDEGLITKVFTCS